jgi:hypothetical protein
MLGSISPVATNSKRVCGVKFTTASFKLLLINVYLPYEDSDNNVDEFCDQLSIIEHLLEEN